MTDEAKALDAGFLYSPLSWERGAATWEPTPGQCRAAVVAGVKARQCTHKAKVTRTVTRHGKVFEAEYCGGHDPVAVDAKRKKREAVRQAEWDARNAADAEMKRIDALRSAALDAIKQIAAGHNDPRALALAVLAKNGGPND